MAHYRLEHLDLSTRIKLAVIMLSPFRPWGEVTRLADEYGVSRKFLYGLRDKALAAITMGLLPQKPGRKANSNVLKVDGDFIRRAIAVFLSVVPGTVRTIQLLLELLFGVHRSVGTISQTAKELGQAAAEHHQGLPLSLLALGEADEIFQGRRPCLTLVDGRSFLVLNLSAEEHRDATTWGSLLLDVQNQGVQFLDLASDGARGIRAGVQEAQLAMPLRPDLFHLIREAHRVTRRLESRAYRAIETAERARRADQEEQTPKRRQGRPLQVKIGRSQAEAQEEQAIRHLDLWTWLFQEIRQALEPFNEQGQLTSAEGARQTLQTAICLLKSLENSVITTFADEFVKSLDDLLAPLIWLEQALAPWRKNLDPETEALIVWAWQHRQSLDLEAGQGFPPNLQAIVMAFWEILALFHRSSSLAECLHSWLRPFLQVHRGIPDWLLPLLQVVWNHHVFARGKRKGKSPLAMAAVEEALTLPELFDRLTGIQAPILAPDWFVNVPKNCYLISSGD